MAAQVIEYDQCGMSTIHRCVRCGAQAWVEVVMPSGSDLVFCSHHYEEHEPKLLEQADMVADHRPFLRAQEAEPTLAR